MHYTMTIAGVTRDLPLCKVNDDLYIGAFVIFGDVELTVASARELLKLAPEHDILITAESKGIPLVYEMARQHGENRYLIARKAAKLYMRDVFSTDVTSITTANRQMLCIDGEDAAYMESLGGKKHDKGRHDFIEHMDHGVLEAVSPQHGNREHGEGAEDDTGEDASEEQHEKRSSCLSG